MKTHSFARATEEDMFLYINPGQWIFTITMFTRCTHMSCHGVRPHGGAFDESDSQAAGFLLQGLDPRKARARNVLLILFDRKVGLIIAFTDSALTPSTTGVQRCSLIAL